AERGLGPARAGLGRQVPRAGRLELGRRRTVPGAAARGRTAVWNFALCPLARSVSWRRGGKSNGLLPAAASYSPRAPAPVGLLRWRRTRRPKSSSDSPTDRHAKRSTINTEDVKLLARRSNSLLKYITEKSEELTQFNSEQRAKKKKKSEEENKKSAEPAEAAAAESDPSTL
uniref:Centromere protein S n=1 Tax=Suricata suricatta TaxID=37032 RepID=A0A673UIW4_SURSU